MKDLLPAYQEYLVPYKDIIANTKQQLENFISRIDWKVDWGSKKTKTCFCITISWRDFLYEYENMDTFHTENNIERDNILYEDILEEFNDNPRHQEKHKTKLKSNIF